MCGIVGMVNGRSVHPYLVKGLSILEYRGYDSAGVAVIGSKLQIRKTKGRISDLEQLLNDHPIRGRVGIGHTRWATHGDPVKRNAHPHKYKNVAVVHNGIIENYKELKAELEFAGHVFDSDTDSEVIPHLIYGYICKGWEPYLAVHKAISLLKGSFAIGVLIEDYADRIIVARRGSPLVIGRKTGAVGFSSDVAVLGGIVDEMVLIEDDEVAELKQHCVTIYDVDGMEKERMWEAIEYDKSEVDLKQFSHFTAKEIAEQPEVLKRTLDSIRKQHIVGSFKNIDRILIVGCGSSYYAGRMAAHWFESFAKLPVDVEIASEFRYRKPIINEGTLAIFISQSGETADTLAAMQYVKEQGVETVVLTNVKYSQMARIADYVWPIDVGAEIGVAATKSFTAQVTALAYAALLMTSRGGKHVTDAVLCEIRELFTLPDLIEKTLKISPQIIRVAAQLDEHQSVLFMGRGASFAAAEEAALKLKELSYIQAEAYASGELKHGPIALVHEGLPVFVFAPAEGGLLEKNISNAQEVAARGAKLIFVTNEATEKRNLVDGSEVIRLPNCSAPLTAILQVVVAQMLSYHTALVKNCDVDKPRNLAKSVTVE